MTDVSTTTTARGVARVDSPAAHAGARPRAREGTDPLTTAQAFPGPAATAPARPTPATPPGHPPAGKPPGKPSGKPARAPRRPRRPRPPLGLTLRRGLAHWWGWTSRPTSLRAAWRASAVNRDRIPLGSTPFGLIWRLSNWTDRLLFFALVMIAPTALTGPLRWLAARPTRRWAFYLLAAGFVASRLPIHLPT